jgi:hypothetical protein
MLRKRPERFLRQIIYYELFGFCLLISITWINELIDFPHYLFGRQPTPSNITESIFESLLILIVGLLVILLTLKLLHQIRHLEGLLPICASCKKIGDGHGHWIQIEGYIRDHSDAEFSHSICPDCAKKLYPAYHFTKRSQAQGLKTFLNFFCRVHLPVIFHAYNPGAS